MAGQELDRIDEAKSLPEPSLLRAVTSRKWLEGAESRVRGRANWHWEETSFLYGLR